jgi:hypothetical protein
MSAFELSKRMLLQEASNKIGIYSSQKASKLIMPILQNLNHEEVWVMFLDVANNLISRERVSIGGISASVVDVRIILKKAMEKLCSKIIVAHNHPSHTPRPGENDIMFTKKLKDAAQLCDIEIELMPHTTRHKALEQRVLNDILSPEFSATKPQHGVMRIVGFKLRRWWANRWKHRLVYREGLIRSFVVHAWSHILKPKEIKQ